jgi:hypothetical protein
MDRIIQLEDIAVSLEEAQQLNNTVPSALAWVFNKYKNIQEFELVSVESLSKDLAEEGEVPKINITVKPVKGEWKIYPSNVFVGLAQIQHLIDVKEFYFAPLKSK